MQTFMNKITALWQTLNKTQLLRHAVQLISFLLFPGLFLTVFNALRDLVTALATGTFAFSAMSGSLVTLAAVFGVTILWGRFFCGYLCSFGALQELLAFAGKKLLPGIRALPKKADKSLKYLKYGMLLAIVLPVWVLQLPVDSSFSPWGVFGALLSGNLSVMGEAVPTVGFGLLLAVMAVSLFVERAFCRYACPLAALFTPLSAGRLYRIRRFESSCSGCQACTRSCAMGITVHEDEQVRSGECIDCMRCLAACSPMALRTAPHPAVAGTASALALCGLIQVGRLAVPDESAAASGYAAGQVVSADSAAPSTKYADGVYTGRGNGFRGTISAQVTVSGGRITDITILSSQDDSDFLQRAQASVIPAVLNSQSVNVSAVSGATYSSRGILEAVADALKLDTSSLPAITDTGRHRGNRDSSGKQEKGNRPSGSAPSSDGTGENGRKRGNRSGGTERGEGSDSAQKPAPQQGDSSRQGRKKGRTGSGQDQTGASGQDRTSPGASGQSGADQPAGQAPVSPEASPSLPAVSAGISYQDGEYTGTGTGYRGATQVSVTVKDGQITDITVVSFKDDQQYFSRAQSSLIPSILKAQGINVNTVSGATFSSNGILEAVADALDIEFTNPNSSMGGRRKGRR